MITQGSRGVSTCLPTGEILTVPARKGNGGYHRSRGYINGAFTVEIAGGSTMEEAPGFANTAASLSTERFGAQGGMPVRSQVLEAMNQENM